MIIVITSCGSRDEAERVATALVEERLAACVQIVPATSVYRWQGKVERAEEHLLHIKTRAALALPVEQRLRTLHSYDLPEVLTLRVTSGSAEYLAWVDAETGG